MENLQKSNSHGQSRANFANKQIEKDDVSIFFSKKLTPLDQIKLALKYPSKF
jgi:hypothetical protein